MKHSIKINENHATITLTEKVYVHDASLLRDDLIEMINRGITDMWIDLSELSYIDSSGLGTLVTINKRIQEKNGKLVMKGPQGLPLELIKRTRLDKVFTIQS